jgi:preprotein translocase subunit SecB
MKITIAQMALERLEFKHRPGSNLPSGVPVPSAGVALNAQVAHQDGNPNAVAVRLTAQSAEDAVYQFKVTYAAYYTLEWSEGEVGLPDLDRRIVVTGCNMLLPFLRETIASVTGRARHGPIWLSPTDFIAMALTAEPVERV